MTDLPLWFWVTLAVMNGLSLLWAALILRDVKSELKSQLWIVGENNRDLLQPKRLVFYRLSFVFSILLLSVLSIVLIPVIL